MGRQRPRARHHEGPGLQRSRIRHHEEPELQRTRAWHHRGPERRGAGLSLMLRWILCVWLAGCLPLGNTVKKDDATRSTEGFNETAKGLKLRSDEYFIFL
ncbi:hypothetical protein RR46_11237 [Papilio xuthus]|uniref:Uncharacterized protein n=1 Tax=Papilio xuthus TaxID=66420 RepID=A0A194PXP7_PAPXU|nr:hypothetical protein RR46_11237 [Papilio xuthus]